MPISNTYELILRAAESRPRRLPSRILVAEDDAEMRALIVQALRNDGFDVNEAANGGRLLGWMTTQFLDPQVSFDLIVSDIRMPIFSGLRILRGLRKANWTVPVILMTAFGDPETRAQAEHLGAILFDKPFALDDLRTAVFNLTPDHGRAGSPLRVTSPQARGKEAPADLGAPRPARPLMMQTGPAEKPSASSTEGNPGRNGEAKNRRRATLILAEDDRDARNVFADALRAAGHTVVEAADGGELLDALAAHEVIDLVLSDVRMPSISGLEALLALRLGGSRVPVIVMTAFGSVETHFEATRLGAAAVLDKPFGVQELLHVVRDVLA